MATMETDRTDASTIIIFMLVLATLAALGYALYERNAYMQLVAQNAANATSNALNTPNYNTISPSAGPGMDASSGTVNENSSGTSPVGANDNSMNSGTEVSSSGGTNTPATTSSGDTNPAAGTSSSGSMPGTGTAPSNDNSSAPAKSNGTTR